MFKERINEVFEFANSESPYRKANKGWINQDIFVDLNPSNEKVKLASETAKVTFFWPPIVSLLSNIFLTIILGSLLVFTSLSFAKGRINFNQFYNSSNISILDVEDNKDSMNNNSLVLESNNSIGQQNLEEKELVQSDSLQLLDDNLIKEDKEIIEPEVEKKQISENEIEVNNDNIVDKNIKPKSNFI